MAKGARDIRVVRVRINRPDLQYTLKGKRHYYEYETTKSPRGPGRLTRIEGNDPNAIGEVRVQD